MLLPHQNELFWLIKKVWRSLKREEPIKLKCDGGFITFDFLDVTFTRSLHRKKKFLLLAYYLDINLISKMLLMLGFMYMYMKLFLLFVKGLGTFPVKLKYNFPAKLFLIGDARYRKSKINRTIKTILL